MTYRGGPSPGHRRGDLITVVVLLLAGGLASGLPREQQSEVESAVRATALFPFLALHRVSAERTQVGRQVRSLLAERDSLVQLLIRYRTLAGEAVQLRADAGLERLQLGSVTSAEVYPGRPRVGDPDVFVLRGRDRADSSIRPACSRGRVWWVWLAAPTVAAHEASSGATPTSGSA